MKVGIMSMQRIINYGSFLQAYGLKKTIESFDNDVIFVDYTPGIILNEEKNETQKHSRVLNAFKVLFSAQYRTNRKRQIKDNKAYSDFYYLFKKNWLPQLGITEEYVLSPDLDVLVIGSDEVFNCTQSNKDVGYCLELFGANHHAKKLISYAASFGSTTLELIRYYRKEGQIGEHLKRFDSISVRDENSHQIVKALLGKEPCDHIDPVLIYDYEKELLLRKPELNDYLIVYAYSGRITDEEASLIQMFAHNHGLKTLSIGVRQWFTDEYICEDPFALLAYFKNAKYVITDTFHGAVFSIKYQIPFATLIRDSNKQKLFDLLKRFDLLHRKVNDISELENVLLGDYNSEAIINKLNLYKKEAMDYLEEHLKSSRI